MAWLGEVKPMIQHAESGSPDAVFVPGASLSAFGGEVSLVAVVPVVALALVAGVLIGRHQSPRKARLEPHVTSSAAKEESAQDSDSLVVPREGGWEMAETRFCPICYGEYVSGTLVCEDCGVELVEETDIPENDPPIEEGLVRVCAINGFLRTQLIRQFLAANHIPCSTSRSMFGDAIGCDFYVFESDALRAKKLIQQYLTDFEGTPV